MKQTNFRSFYAPLIPTLTKIGYCVQLVSGLTAAVGVWAVIYPRLQIFGPIAAGFVAALLTLLCIYTIEGGLRTFLPFTIRQAVRAEFGNRWFIGMFAPLAVVTVLLFSATSLLSWFASPEIVTAASPEVELHDLSESKREEYAHRKRITEAYSAEKEETLAMYDGKIKAVKEQAKTDIRHEKNKANRLKETRPQDTKWLFNHVIPKRRKRRDAELIYIEELKTADLKGISERQEEELKHHREQYALIIAGKNTHNTSTLSRHEEGRTLWGSALAVFALACGFILLLTFVIIEVYTAGSEPVKPPGPSKVVLISQTETRPHAETENIETGRGNISMPETVKPFETKGGSPVQKVKPPTVLVHGFGSSFTAAQCKKKVQEYTWKLNNGKGKTETNETNIIKFQKAIETLQKST